MFSFVLLFFFLADSFLFSHSWRVGRGLSACHWRISREVEIECQVGLACWVWLKARWRSYKRKNLVWNILDFEELLIPFHPGKTFVLETPVGLSTEKIWISVTLNRKRMNQCDSQQKTYESVWLSTENVWISETLNRKRMNQCDSQQKTYESVWLSTENVWISVTLNRKHMNHSAWTGCNQNVTPSYCGSLQKAIEWDHSSGRICQQFLHLSIMSQFPLHPCLTLCKRYIATVGMFMYCRSLFSSISIFFPVPHK